MSAAAKGTFLHSSCFWASVASAHRLTGTQVTQTLDADLQQAVRQSSSLYFSERPECTMPHVRHSASHLANLGVAGLANALQHMLLEKPTATEHSLRELANKLQHVVTYLHSQADSTQQPQQQQPQQQQQHPDTTKHQQLQPQGDIAPAAVQAPHSLEDTVAAKIATDAWQPPATSPAASDASLHLSNGSVQQAVDLNSMKLAAPQIITAEGQSRRSKRKLGDPLPVPPAMLCKKQLKHSSSISWLPCFEASILNANVGLCLANTLVSQLIRSF